MNVRPWHNWVTKNLRELLKQRENIVVHVVDIDKYDRKVVVTFIKGKKESLNEKMVKRGVELPPTFYWM